MRSTRAVRRRIGKRIAQLRIERALSQEAVAEFVGLNAKHLSLIELGTTNVGIDTLIGMAECFDVDLSELFMPAKGGSRPVDRIWTGRDYREFDEALTLLAGVRRGRRK